eukprot:10654285-Karenia_brevis.AAC.1
MAEINGLSEPWVRVLDARWYKLDRKSPNPFEGVTDDVLNQSTAQHPDICKNMDPHSLIKDHFAYNRGNDRMQILSMEYGAWGLDEYFTHVHIAVSAHESSTLLTQGVLSWTMQGLPKAKSQTSHASSFATASDLDALNVRGEMREYLDNNPGRRVEPCSDDEACVDGIMRDYR